MQVTDKIVSAIELIYIKVYNGDYNRKQARAEVKKVLEKTTETNVVVLKRPKSAFSPRANFMPADEVKSKRVR